MVVTTVVSLWWPNMCTCLNSFFVGCHAHAVLLSSCSGWLQMTMTMGMGAATTTSTDEGTMVMTEATSIAQVDQLQPLLLLLEGVQLPHQQLLAGTY